MVLELLGLGGIWSWRRQYFLWTIAIVAFAWIGNYYSAFMASLAAGATVSTRAGYPEGDPYKTCV